MNKAYCLLFLFSSLSFAAPLEIQERWSNVSDPLIMSRNYEIRFFALPLSGVVNRKQRFWSGDYWALNKGNINKRWHAGGSFKLASPTFEQAKALTIEQLAQFSPAEKFDLLNGRYDYPLKHEVIKIADPNAKNWEGICHGWAPAAMNHNEPTPKSLRNRDGLVIPFGSADIKAILSYYYAYPYQVPNTHQVGRRCDDSAINNNNDCKKDLNAGAFHIILSNRIGLENEGFIADINRYREVWNHPIMQYSSKIKNDSRGAGTNSAPGTVRVVRVDTKITYADETNNYWNPTQGTNLQKVDHAQLSYSLEIDAYGQIIGGEWNSIQRPDFLWIKEKPDHFLSGYTRLADLLND